jgi:hypothetical protein
MDNGNLLCGTGSYEKRKGSYFNPSLAINEQKLTLGLNRRKNGIKGGMHNY